MDNPFTAQVTCFNQNCTEFGKTKLVQMPEGSAPDGTPAGVAVCGPVICQCRGILWPMPAKFVTS